jgi:WD40 repeat protein
VLLHEDDCSLLLRPDGRQFAAAKGDGSIRLFDTATGEEIRRYQVGATAFSWAWNPKLAKIAVLTPQSCFVLDLESAGTSPVPIPGVGPNMAWHPNGQILALVADRRIHLWDSVKGGLIMPPLVGHKTDGVRVKFNHSGDQLLSLDWSALWRLWDTQTGTQLLTMPANGDILSFSRDDRLAGADTTSPRIRLFRIHPGHEFRSLAHHNNAQPSAYDADSALHADGQLLAIRVPEGIALIDLARHEEVDVVPIPRNRPIRFDLKANELWTNGSKGLVSWPLQAAPDAGAIRLGPPRLLSPFNHEVTIGASTDGQTIAFPNLERGALLWQRADNRTLPLEPQEDVRACAVSPDGRWVATGSHDSRHSAGGKIWDATTGMHVADLPVGHYCNVRFSPDSHWLVTTSGGMRIWNVGTWTEGPNLSATALDCGFTFSADSKLLAIGDSKGVVRLLVTETGKELARLTSPEPTRVMPLHFTPDGTKLVSVGAESSALHIFDLRAIREQLAELGLDWEQPAYPPESPVDSAPLRIQVVLDDVPK